MATTVPVRHPIQDRQTGLLTRPWMLFFQNLAAITTTVIGQIAWTTLPTQNGSTLVGRGAGASGAPEVITLGAGLTMTGTTLSVNGSEVLVRRWEPLVSGDIINPDTSVLIFALEDVIMVGVPE